MDIVKRKLKAFTLIEMLIVMGILVLLISVSVIVARYAIRRSNIVHHMSAAQDIERALLRFKNEEKYVPQVGTCGTCIEDEFFAYSLGYKGNNAVLKEYLEEFPFDGGGDATYYYATDDIGQFFVVCVSLGGIDDESHLGYYCTGTGIGFVPEGNPIQSENIEPDDMGQIAVINGMDDSDWDLNSGFANAREIN